MDRRSSCSATDSMGATLDRNGLRPARYTRLEDGTVYVMSETGVVPIEDEAQVAEKGRLRPWADDQHRPAHALQRRRGD